MEVALSCCLCRKTLAKDKRRRRKLHGPSCLTMKEHLQKLSSVSLESLVETSDENAYLCSSCEVQLKSVESLEDKLSGLKSEIRGMLSDLRSVLGTPVESLRKRQLQGSCNQPAPKQPCMISAAVSVQEEESERLQSFLSHTPMQALMSTSHQPLGDASPDVQVFLLAQQSISQNDALYIFKQVNISYQTGRRKVINVNTPVRKQGIKRLARRQYKSLASMMLTTTDCSKSTVVEFARKIRGEMQKLSSEAHDSILRDTLEAVKHFSWDTVMLEYAKMIPTLIMLLESLIPNPTARKPLVCFVASLLLKCRHQRMGLVQRAISIMLYGNGSSKQASFDL